MCVCLKELPAMMEKFCICTGQCDRRWPREHLNSTCYLILINLNVNNLTAKTIKLLDENSGVNLCDLGLGSWFLWEKIILLIYLIRTLYLEYIKISYNSMIKRQTD